MFLGILIQLSIQCYFGVLYGGQQYVLTQSNYEVSLNKNWDNHTRSNIMDMWDGQGCWLGIYSIVPDQIKPDEIEKALLDTMFYYIEADEHNKMIILCEPFESDALAGVQYVAKSNKWIDNYFVLRSKNDDGIYFAVITKKLIKYVENEKQQLHDKIMIRNIVNSIQMKNERDKFTGIVKELKNYLYRLIDKHALISQGL